MGASQHRNPASYYRTGELLRAKHRLARTDSGRRFEEWALGLVAVSPAWRVLDAGCGWGRFTWSLVNGTGAPAEQVVCADLSLGMLLTAREEAGARGARVQLCQTSIEALPFPDRAFDLAIAAHVLYHLPDVAGGARELARVLRPDGCLLATTNSGRARRVLVLELHRRALEDLGIPSRPAAEPFSMENGRPPLEAAFGHVETHSFRHTQTAPDVTTFMAAYRTIGRYRLVAEDPSIPAATRARLAARVEELAEQVLAREGVLRSQGLMGAFVCREPPAWPEAGGAASRCKGLRGRTPWTVVGPGCRTRRRVSRRDDRASGGEAGWSARPRAGAGDAPTIGATTARRRRSGPRGRERTEAPRERTQRRWWPLVSGAGPG